MTVGLYVTLSGLTIPTVEDLLGRINSDQQSDIDVNLDVDPDLPGGQVNGIVASYLREAWEAVDIAYHSNDPDEAEGYLLDALSSITGTFRGAATASAFTAANPLTLNLNTGAFVPAGAIVAQAGNPLVTFSLVENVQATAAGNYPARALCTQIGPVAANAGTMTVIATPYTGWNSVTNAADAYLGVNENSDSALRLRRIEELADGGTSTQPAIAAGLLAYVTVDNAKPIQSAIVYENSTDYYDAAGRPPHAIEAVIYDGDSPSVANDIVAQIIWDNLAGGIQAFGSDKGGAKDYLGNDQNVLFSRATSLQVKGSITVVYDRQQDPPSEQEIKDAIAASFAAQRKLGQTKVRWTWFDVWRDVGGLESSNVQIGAVGGALLAAFTDLVVPVRRIAALDTSNLTITIQAGAV